MAPVAGRPFLAWVIDYWQEQGIRDFIFSLGYKHEMLTTFLEERFPLLNKQYVIEEEPMGTGGAIRLACHAALSDQVLIVNGDTLFKVQLPQLEAFHLRRQSDCTLALKPMQHPDRYGTVELDANGRILHFREKQLLAEGAVNGGVYIVERRKFLEEELPEKFSFEKDYLEKFFTARPLYGLLQDDYFIDIGIPEDFARANKELEN